METEGGRKVNEYESLYLVGCFISLGFGLGTVREVKKGDVPALLFGAIVSWFLSWAGVIAEILWEKVREGKK